MLVHKLTVRSNAAYALGKRSVVSLRSLTAMTEPGGGFYEAQKRAANSMRIWDTLFNSAREAAELHGHDEQDNQDGNDPMDAAD
mmetsp:Transcript_11843/g.21120  ORF Transcript_11843/g.21120 Transcript_11843/m.21120 type:complete len:84 (+) Transcript_11843:224-475(+)